MVGILMIHWLVLWNIPYFPSHIWDVILPIDELHHFSRWLKTIKNQIMLSYVTMIYNVCKKSINIILYILYHLDKEFDPFGDVTASRRSCFGDDASATSICARKTGLKSLITTAYNQDPVRNHRRWEYGIQYDPVSSVVSNIGYLITYILEFVYDPYWFWSSNIGF